jgi:hypothetical protein
MDEYWVNLQPYHGESKLRFEVRMMSVLYYTNMLSCIVIVQACYIKLKTEEHEPKNTDWIQVFWKCMVSSPCSIDGTHRV